MRRSEEVSVSGIHLCGIDYSRLGLRALLQFKTELHLAGGSWNSGSGRVAGMVSLNQSLPEVLLPRFEIFLQGAVVITFTIGVDGSAAHLREKLIRPLAHPEVYITTPRHDDEYML